MASFVAPIISGLAGLFGGGQQQKVETSGKQSQEGQQSQSSSGQTSGTITPNLSPFQQQLAELFTKGAGDFYNSSTNLTPYTTSGLQQIQQQGGANNQILSNIMASRGLSFSPAGANPEIQNTLNTGNQANSFLQSIPLLQRQLQQQSLSGLISAFGALPTGTTSTGQSSQLGQANFSGSGTSSGTQTTSGNPIGGLLGGIGAGLMAPQGNGNGNALSNIIGMFSPKSSSQPVNWSWGG